MPRRRSTETQDRDGFRPERADWLAIAVLGAMATVTRLVFLLSLPPLLHLDSDSYFEIAQRLWRGEGFGDLSRRAPFYPLFLWLTGRSPTAGLFPAVLAQHALGVATVLLFYFLARRMMPPEKRGIAVVSGLALAIAPYPILLEHSILSESLFVFLLAASAYAMLAWWQEGRDRHAIACGMFLALAVLTRPVGAGLLPLWAGMLFLFQDKKKAARFLLLAGLAWSALLLPLLLHNYRTMGKFGLEQSVGRNLISVADRWIVYESAVHPEVKAIYRKYAEEKRGPDAVVVYAAMPELRRATGWSDPQIDRALAAIAGEAIRARPLEFVASRLRRLPLLLRDPGPSQWYALQAETYLPLLEFVGRINPELASRSVAFPGLKQARFERAERAYRILAMDLPSGAWIAFCVAGVLATLWAGRLRVAWLWAALLAYRWLGTILLQPPNARYRLLTFHWEVLFVAAGVWFLLPAAIRLAGWAGRALAAASGEPRTAGKSFSGGSTAASLSASPSDGSLLWLATVVTLAILGGRALLARNSAPILRTADFGRAQGRAQGAQGDDSASVTPALIRQLPVAGQSLTVLYWNESSPGVERVVSAEASIRGGGAYAARVFYSCQTAACGGAELQLSALDDQGRQVAQTAAPLAQERVDNDLFWDQWERRLSVPEGARRFRADLRLRGGQGNLVVPWISVRAGTSLLP